LTLDIFVHLGNLQNQLRQLILHCFEFLGVFDCVLVQSFETVALHEHDLLWLGEGLPHRLDLLISHLALVGVQKVSLVLDIPLDLTKHIVLVLDLENESPRFIHFFYVFPFFFPKNFKHFIDLVFKLLRLINHFLGHTLHHQLLVFIEPFKQLLAQFADFNDKRTKLKIVFIQKNLNL
jgi:hypothetical protein